ncbi:MAG: SPOR domain-containing protein [Candidatus Omnitrophota bacterium]|jgi:cell division septation protein DedD
MSKVDEQLNQLRAKMPELEKNTGLRLDPFVDRPDPVLWRRLKAALTFDRLILFGFVVIAGMVLTYRAGIHKRAEPFETAVSTVADTPALALIRNEEPPKPAETVQTPVVAEPVISVKDFSVPLPVPQAFTPFFTIQAATYLKKDRAASEIEWLRAHGHEAFLVTGQKHFVVCIGRHPAKSEADRALKQISKGDFKKRYKGAYVRPVKSPP